MYFYHADDTSAHSARADATSRVLASVPAVPPTVTTPIVLNSFGAPSAPSQPLSASAPTQAPLAEGLGSAEMPSAAQLAATSSLPTGPAPSRPVAARSVAFAPPAPSPAIAVSRAPVSRPATKPGKARARASPAAKKQPKKKKSPAVAGHSGSSIEQPRATPPPTNKAPSSSRPERTGASSAPEHPRPASTQRSSPPILYVDSGSDSDSGYETTLPASSFPGTWRRTQPSATDPSSSHASAAPSPSEEPPVPTPAQPPIAGAAPTTARPAFNLTDFLSQSHSGLQAVPAPSSPPGPGPSTPTRADARGVQRRPADGAQALPPAGPNLADVLTELLTFLRSQPAALDVVHPAASSSASHHAQLATGADATSSTVPNHKGMLLPPATRNLRAAHFQPPAHRVRGDFVPTATHDLAAHRLVPFLTSPEGMHESAMAYVLRARQGFTFDDAPAIAIAAYSARFGRHGLSIMHCKRADRAARLRAGSGDANFVMDFGRGVTPPPAPACTTYFDLLGAVQGLASYANANWHEPMAHVLYRVREFVTANMDADPANTPCRVERTLHEVNQFLGAAFAPLASDSPYWWRDFSMAASQIEFRSVSWSLALAELAHTPATPTPQPPRGVSMDASARHSRGRNAPDRPGGIPSDIRRIIPRNEAGHEPCLKFFAGGMCEGGTREVFAAQGRTHIWSGELPVALKAFISKRFGSRRGSQNRRS
ncbi:hypothetical protein PF005_g19897 [Phytophthora fragariae]|uniref:Uncharacterized protein n=1 Tax=Phytophthora fragariae TaxID=53985 RepID=A0A6A3R2W0_9STRA|nr:hypothetical protein PF003_g31993 [Phytophthora fragariae]KAE9088123.1 hypothetical protein PF007_g20102 [Phytophthora fragariae]KAE9117958.1 hypothetical protein PF006_g18707 [Phytophthora fragariae]KAE9188845.1 hypothetical protein PF005_g19897 [Phytophthora fragariae]KAE9203334.1 hypothetical protein PF002_g20964 [Phytophthora fragariae]